MKRTAKAVYCHHEYPVLRRRPTLGCIFANLEFSLRVRRAESHQGGASIKAPPTLLCSNVHYTSVDIQAVASAFHPDPCTRRHTVSHASFFEVLCKRHRCYAGSSFVRRMAGIYMLFVGSLTNVACRVNVCDAQAVDMLCGYQNQLPVS